LKGVKLPLNIRAEADIFSATKDATLLVFVVPHQFLPHTLQQLKGKLCDGVKAISLIKGMEVMD
jgi:glycerol-3-phosphate dehydrogenase (NAD+)